MQELKIRIATRNDMEDIAAISRTTWEGADYLEACARRWIGDRSLFAGELEGRLVGTFRICPMPHRVLWLEALRVHIDYQGCGLGRKLSDAAFDMGKNILERGEAECMEFSTYILNHESIHITTSQGFQVVNRFIIMTKEEIHESVGIDNADLQECDFTGLGDHIPCGWKYPRLCSEGIEWALKRCDAYRAGDVCFLKLRNADEMTPLTGALDDPDGFLNGAETAALMTGSSNSCIVVHESWKNVINRAFQRGYSTWEPVDGYNVLVFRYNM